MSECGIISSAWACVRSQGHGGGHVYETRPVNDSLAAAEERGREEIRQAMDGSWSDERAQAEIRQAEERGRRAGIEDAAKLVLKYQRDIFPNELAALIRSLAPRDSGKETAADAMDAAMEAWEDRK